MKKMIVVMMVLALSASGLSAGPRTFCEEPRLIAEVPLTCNIRIKGSYKNEPIDVTVTVEAENCATAAGDLLRAIISKK